jgi:hypothetical protein
MSRDVESDKLLAKIIDNSLKEVLNEKATSVIYACLKTSYALDQEEVPQRLDLFVAGLRKFLNTSAYAVEHVILENLCSNLNCTGKLELENENDFENFILPLKNCLNIR